ncbi:inorganic phosphate transporter, partial [Streptomyces sp. SID10244]|nr:inorganic phosphate transporter [Streptomyces sp. SID10244]
AQVRWAVAGRMAIAWVTTLPAAGLVGALCFGIAHLLGNTLGAVVIFGLLIVASGYMYWRAQQNKVDASNVNAEWDDSTNSIIPAETAIAEAKAPVA